MWKSGFSTVPHTQVVSQGLPIFPSQHFGFTGFFLLLSLLVRNSEAQFAS